MLKSFFFLRKKVFIAVFIEMKRICLQTGLVDISYI